MSNNFLREGNLDDDAVVDGVKGKVRFVSVLTGEGVPAEPPPVPEKPWTYYDITDLESVAVYAWVPDGESWVPAGGGGGSLATPIQECAFTDGDVVLDPQARTVTVGGYEGGIVFIELPAPASPDYVIGRVVDFNCISPGSSGQAVAYWVGDLPATPGSVGIPDGLFVGQPDPSFDWSSDPETQHWNTGDVVLDQDYGDVGGYFAALVAKMNDIDLVFDLSDPMSPVVRTAATGSSATVQLMSIARGAISSGFGTTSIGIGTDAQVGAHLGIGSKGLTTDNWDAVLWEPGILESLPLEDAQGASIIALEDGWYVRNSGRKPNTADRISTHLNGAPDPTDSSDPLTGPGLRTFSRDNIENIGVTAEIAARLALGRVIAGDDIDVSSFGIRRGDSWQDSSQHIIQYKPWAAAGDADQPWITGHSTVMARNYTQPHTLFLPDGLDPKMGGSVTVIADNSVDGVNSCVVVPTEPDTIDGQIFFPITAAGTYRFERTDEGWTLVLPAATTEVVYRGDTHASPIPVGATVAYLDASSQDPWQHFLPAGSDLPDGKVYQVYRVDNSGNVATLEINPLNPEVFHLGGGTVLTLYPNVAVQVRWDAANQLWWACNLWDSFD